jgi:hypothetical protein
MLNLRRNATLFRRPFLGTAFAALAGFPLAAAASAQVNAVVSSEVTVSGERASLQLELQSGELISVEFTGGNVEVDGAVIGQYQEGGDLERSWRALLGEAASLEPEQIPALVAGWTPPAGLQGDLAQVAEQVRGRLSLEGVAAAPALQNPGDGVGASLQALMARPERFREFAAISDELDVDNLRVHVGEDVTVALGETVESTLVVVDGQVRIDGTVNGDVVLLGADADLGPDGRITGSVFHEDADIDGDLDGIVGEVDEIDASVGLDAPDLPVRPTRPNLPDRLSVEVDPPGPFRSIGRGIAGLVRTFVTFAIAFGAGLGILYFFPRNLELVSRAARQSSGKSLLVGFAGIILAIPVWVIGTVLLAISIIGIPLLLVWVPMFPVALAGALVLGAIGIARNVGGWVSSRDLSGLSGWDTSRPALQIGTGLALLLGAFAVANLFEMAGSWFQVFEVVFTIVAILGCVLVAAVGLGAVILSRGGRVQTFAGAPPTPGSGYAPEDSPLGA